MVEDGVIVEAGAVDRARAAIGSGTVVAAECRHRPVVPDRPRLLYRARASHPVRADRQPRHHPWRRQIGQDGFGFVGGPKVPERCRRSAVSSSRTMSRSAPTRRSIAAPWPTRSSARAPRSTISCRSPTTCASAAIASSPAMSGMSGSVTLGDIVMIGGGVGIADHMTIGTGRSLPRASALMRDIPAGERWARLRRRSRCGSSSARWPRSGASWRQETEGRARTAMVDRSTDRRSRRSTSCELMKLLPHRYPFLLVDRIIDIDGDNRRSASRTSRSTSRISRAISRVSR